MMRMKKEFITDQVVKNRVDIELLQKRMKEQEDINASEADAFDKATVVFAEMDRKIRFLKKMTAGFVLLAGWLVLEVMGAQSEIREIRKAMNEG